MPAHRISGIRRRQPRPRKPMTLSWPTRPSPPLRSYGPPTPNRNSGRSPSSCAVRPAATQKASRRPTDLHRSHSRPSMMRKRISDAETAPVRVVIVTMDGHLAGAVERASDSLRKELPGLDLVVHSADEWGSDTEALA